MTQVRLQTLSPVYIGVSQEQFWQKDIDFFQDGDRIYVVRLDDIFQQFQLPPSDIERLAADLSQGNLGNFNHYLVQQRQLNLKEVAYKSFQFNGRNINEIRPMIGTTSGEVMIPSSSLKGAVRTAFLRHLILQKPHFVGQQSNLGSKNYRGFNFSDSQVQKRYLGNDPKQDTFRLIRFSDFYFKESTCAQVQIMNLYNNGRWDTKKGQTTVVECIPKDQSTTGTLKIPQHLLKHLSHWGKVSNIDLLQPKKLCKIINEATLAILDARLAFWNDEVDTPELLDHYIGRLEEIEEIAKNCQEHECVIRLGGAVGWDFITGAWAKESATLDDETWGTLKASLRRKQYARSTPYPKTCKLNHEGEPLGFVKMSFQYT